MSISLLNGWLPPTIQMIAAVIVMVAVGRRSRRWLMLWVPVALLVGVLSAAIVHWYINDQALAGEPAPSMLWLWIVLTGFAATVLAAGWRESRWLQRSVALLAVPMCLLCAALAVNLWVSYFPTAGAAWDRLTGAPLANQSDTDAVAQMQRNGVHPTKGTLVSVKIPSDASGFKARAELVYLPPAWYATNPPPRLPAILMIGGEFGHPSDWSRLGAQEAVDNFASAHDGNAPVLVFVDSGGAFVNDTECVNGPRGMAADHLTKDVVPYVISHFGVSADPANWGIAGWSAGGTCALTLTVMHPELFSAFLDIDGQMGPNAGTKEQTIHRLFGGDADAWATFDPKTVITKHGPYAGVSAWFAVSDQIPNMYADGLHPDGEVKVPQLGTASDDLDHVGGADRYLCALASAYGIECAVVSNPGSHDFRTAASVFASALPWLAGKLNTPGVPTTPLPGAPG